MSGGSFEYLADRFADDPLSRATEDNLNKMDRLLREHYPNHDATRDTQKVIALVEAIEEMLNFYNRKLYNVWHEAEWWQSGDTSKADMDRIMGAYDEH